MTHFRIKKEMINIDAKCLSALSRSIFSQRMWPIVTQDSGHTCIPQKKLATFCTMIGQLGWEKIDLIRALKQLVATLLTIY